MAETLPKAPQSLPREAEGSSLGLALNPVHTPRALLSMASTPRIHLTVLYVPHKEPSPSPPVKPFPPTPSPCWGFHLCCIKKHLSSNPTLLSCLVCDCSPVPAPAAPSPPLWRICFIGFVTAKRFLGREGPGERCSPARNPALIAFDLPFQLLCLQKFNTAIVPRSPDIKIIGSSQRNQEQAAPGY